MKSKLPTPGNNSKGGGKHRPGEGRVSAKHLTEAARNAREIRAAEQAALRQQREQGGR